MGKAPSFGYSDARPIKEQRESLPIFRLREQLIQAVNEHQVSCRIPFWKAHHAHCSHFIARVQGPQ